MSTIERNSKVKSSYCLLFHFNSRISESNIMWDKQRSYRLLMLNNDAVLLSKHKKNVLNVLQIMCILTSGMRNDWQVLNENTSQTTVLVLGCCSSYIDRFELIYLHWNMITVRTFGCVLRGFVVLPVSQGYRSR